MPRKRKAKRATASQGSAPAIKTRKSRSTTNEADEDFKAPTSRKNQAAAPTRRSARLSKKNDQAHNDQAEAEVATLREAEKSVPGKKQAKRTRKTKQGKTAAESSASSNGKPSLKQVAKVKNSSSESKEEVETKMNTAARHYSPTKVHPASPPPHVSGNSSAVVITDSDDDKEKKAAAKIPGSEDAPNENGKRAEGNFFVC